MRSPRFAQMRCIYSGQRQPIMRRTSRLHSWDVFAYEPLPIACVLRTWLLDGSARRQTTGVAVLRRGFVDDERTAQMCEDGWLNLSVIPITAKLRCPVVGKCGCPMPSLRRRGIWKSLFMFGTSMIVQSMES